MSIDSLPRSGRISMRSAPESTSPYAWLVLLAIFANVFLATLYNITAAELFSTLQDFSAASIVLVLSGALLVHHRTDLRGAMFIALWIFALTIHSALNFASLDYADWLKFVSIFVLFLAGTNLNFEYGKGERALLLALAVLPVLVEFFGGSRVYPDGDAIAIFQNANTAVLYYMSILFAFAPIFGHGSILAHILLVLLFQKIGILLATVVGLGISSLVRARTHSLAALALLGVVLGIGYLLGLLDRPIAVLTMMAADFSTIGLDGISQMSFAGLYERNQSSDLSGYFRVLHWSNIVGLMGQGDLLHLLFGVGGGVTPSVTTLHNVPHNDYLKVAFEYGLVLFVIFSVLVVRVYVGVEQREQKALFLVLCIYFLSENVVNNYSSTAMFFFFAGLSLKRSRSIVAPGLSEAGRPRAVQVHV